MPSDTQVIYSMMRVGRVHPPNKQVLRDISLGFYYGAKIGVLGLNGAGKSTLLKILSRITPPTKGRVVLRGRVSSLLEVGTGFHPELTGRDKVAAILIGLFGGFIVGLTSVGSGVFFGLTLLVVSIALSIVVRSNDRIQRDGPCPLRGWKTS